MNVKLVVCFFVFLLVVPQCFGFWWLFEEQKPPLVLLREKDLNGEDVNFGNLWADTAWITRLYADDVNVTDFNVTGDMNITGSAVIYGDLEVGGDVNVVGFVESLNGFVSDLFCSFSDLENCLDASGPVWSLDNAGLYVDGDLTGFDITAENDLSVTNDLDVTDNADIHGALVVDEDLNVGLNTGLGGDLWVEGVSYFVDDVFFAGDSNFVNIGVSEGAYLNRLNATGDANFANIGVSENIWLDNDIIGKGGIDFNKEVIDVETFYHFFKYNDDTASLAFGKTQSKDCGSGEIIASGDGSFAWGYHGVDCGGGLGTIRAAGNGSFAGGYVGNEENEILASTIGSFAGGYSTGIIGSYGYGSFGWGYGDINAGNEISDKGAIALGYNVQSLEEASVTLGKNLTNYNANSVLVQDLNVLGDLNAANFSVSGISFLDGGITATGDSNFANIGVSGNYYSDGNITTTGTGRFDSGLIDSGSLLSVDIENNQLMFAGVTAVVDWGANILTNTAGIKALDWSVMQLYASNGTDIILDWSTVGLADFKDTDINTTGDLNVFGNVLIGGDLNVLGNFDVGGVSFLEGGISATGDSNFANIGVSGNYYSDGNVNAGVISFGSGMYIDSNGTDTIIHG